MHKTAKLFSNGGSQAVRLPVEFRFSGDQVYVWRDERTGDVVLAAKGRRIGDFDEMIAAHALALDATLVTDNVRHFSRVAGLRIENWVR